MNWCIVPARTGLDWVRAASSSFRRQPLAMAALFFMSMAAMSCCRCFRSSAPALALALLPLGHAGPMMVALGRNRQGASTPNVLLVVFPHRRGSCATCCNWARCTPWGFAGDRSVGPAVDGASSPGVPVGPRRADRGSIDAKAATQAICHGCPWCCTRPCRCCSGMRPEQL